MSEVDKSLALMGLVAVYEEEPWEWLYLWPENVASWNLYQAVSTQWVHGLNGPVGLNYQSIESVMRMQRIKPRKQREALHDLQVMERAALRAWRENS